MDMSDAQFEQLVGLIAESRVEFRQAISDLKIDLQAGFAGVRKNQVVAHETLVAVEGDLATVQGLLRKHEQALDGLTQLSKTNFDILDTVRKQLSGESITMTHGETEESRGLSPG